jgi:anti-sigma-K factor RskA
VPAWVLAAAAAVIVVVVGAVAFAGSGDDETVVAAARLEPLAPAEPATAELVDADGRLRLDLPLATDDLPATEGFYEVWLIDTQVERLISLGPVRPDATYVVPADIDYRDFPIVDVSVEPPDGDPTHSGDSILRGTLS